MLKRTPKIFADKFLDELKEIEKESKEVAHLEPIDLSALDTIPPQKKENKSMWYKEQYRKRKEW
jgi:hypothetical protein